MLRTSVSTPILDLHLGSYFTILNNPYTILKTTHDKHLFDGNTASFSWEMAALLLCLPEQTEIVFVKNSIEQYDIYLPLLDMLFSNVDYKDKSANDKAVNRLKTAHSNFDQNFWMECIQHKTLLNTSVLNKNSEYLTFEFMSGQNSFKICAHDKYNKPLTCKTQSLNSSQLSKVQGLYGLDSIALQDVYEYFGLEGFDNKVEMNFFFKEVLYSSSIKFSHPLSFVVFVCGSKQVLAIPRHNV